MEMSVSWKKVVTDLWSNKTRTILMILTITLGVFSVGLVNNIGDSMMHDMDADFHSINPHDAIIYISSFNEDWVRSMRRMPGVADAEGRTQLSAQLVNADGSKTNISFDVIKPFTSIRVDKLTPANPTSGSLPTLTRKGVVLDRSVEGLGFQTGDLLTIELPNGETRQLVFQGYVHDVSSVTFAMTGSISAYINSETGEYLGASTDYNKLLVSVTENNTDSAYVSSVAQTIADRFKKKNIEINMVSVYNPGHHYAWQVTEGVIFILFALGWMTVLLSVFLIVNTVVGLMTQHVRQIGIMKAIGGGLWQIFLMYLVLILTFGAVALLISIPLAHWSANQIGKFLADYLNYNIGPTSFNTKTIFIQTILAFVIPLMAALAPMLKALRIPVREAISDYGIGNISGEKATLAESRLAFISRPILVSLRNAVRHKARLSLTLFVLVLGGAIFISVINLWFSFGKSLESIQGYFLADINLSFTQSYPLHIVNSIAKKVPGVVGTEGWLTSPAQAVSEDGKKYDEIMIIAPPSNSTLIKPVITRGRWLTPYDTNAIVIGNHFQQLRPDLKVGDWITIKIGNEQKKWQIVGFYRLIGNVSPPLLYTNYEILSRVLSKTNQVYELRVITSDHDAESQIAVSQVLQEEFKIRDIPIAYVEQGAVWIKQQTNQTDVLVYFMLGMAVLIVAVGGLGLASMMSINVMERTREIGVMRAVGALNRDIQNIVITEGIAVGLASWIMAVILSIPITYILDYGVGVAIMQTALPAIFNWNGSLIWLFGILAVASLASVIPANRAARMTVRETLVYE